MSVISAPSAASQSAPAAAEEAIKSAPQDSLANKEAFLQMLVAQIQNQDPLNPTDGVEFLSQLAQFSELEQMLGMREDISSLRVLAENAAESSSAEESGS